MKNFSGRAAFTLIEVLLAITMMSIIMSAAYKGISQISRTKVTLDDERQVVQIANITLSRLSRELQMALVDNSNKVIFEKYNEFYLRGVNQDVGGASADQIFFVASEAGQYLPEGQRSGGIVTIGYNVLPNPERSSYDSMQDYVLVRSQWPNLETFEAAQEQSLVFPLSEQIAGFDLAYFDAESTQWLEEWDNQQYLPKLIRIKLELISPRGKVMSFMTTVPLLAEQ